MRAQVCEGLKPNEQDGGGSVPLKFPGRVYSTLGSFKKRAALTLQGPTRQLEVAQASTFRKASQGYSNHFGRNCVALEPPRHKYRVLEYI